MPDNSKVVNSTYPVDTDVVLLTSVDDEKSAYSSHRSKDEIVKRLSGEKLFGIFENYLHYYASGEGHTARAKRYDLQHFLEFLAGDPSKHEGVLVSAWTRQSTQDFVDFRLSLGESPATVSRRLATIKHVGRTLAERVHGFINPAREVKGPVLQNTRPHGLEPKDVQLLREAGRLYCEQKELSFQSVRNRFLLELLLATGLRADEVRLLLVGQISEDLQWLKNVKTKGRKFRNVYLDSEIRILLEEYLERRAKELEDYCRKNQGPALQDLQKLPVLISFYRANPGKISTFGMSSKTIWRAIAHFGRMAQALSSEVIGNLHPHRLRHTFAHGLLDSTRDVRLVAQALGHSDVRTTMRYTERSEEQIARAIEEKVSKNQRN